MLQKSPMLDHRGEETEDTEGNKTLSENQGGINVFGGSGQSGFHQNISALGDGGYCHASYD